jgi:glycine/D-amino acid oxidase-like deaminating enzyme
MKIAVLGAGFCGVAVCWHLLKRKGFDVTLFDPKGICGGASGIAAGLLHPYAGLHAKLNWQGQEGMAATHALLDIAEKELGRPVADRRGILRLALTPSQVQDYRRCVSRFSDTEWLEASETARRFPSVPPTPALFIRTGITVDCLLYLQGLWQACLKKGARLELQSVSCLDELQGYDKVIACLGASARSFKETSELPLSLVKGQILELAWPEGLPPLPCTLNSQAYLSLQGGICLAGSTFERGFEEEGPDMGIAEALLRPKITELFPALASAKALRVKAGIRAVTPNHLPSLDRLGERLYNITGMGSKGLLYHAMIAKMCVDNLK